ncbi:MAG: 30S ribosomal protein S8 [Candidatus Andersenbacteria bacterium]|nr:30S ribosomal protein S8 [Candidatus Andersenbacteria bacterium]
MDPIADMLTTLLNAQRVGKKRVVVPYSTFKKSLLDFLQQKGVIAACRVQESSKAKLVVTLKYDDSEQPVLHGVRRFSKPGSRYYVGSTEIPYSYQGVGFVVISTSQGLKDEKQARREKIGGELVCAIW